MAYRNDSPDADSAMEIARTGNYGYDYDNGDECVCRVCGSVFADFYYKNDNNECVGCNECLCRSDTPY